MKKILFSLILFISFIGVVDATVCSKMDDAGPIKYICNDTKMLTSSSLSEFPNNESTTATNDLPVSINDNYFNATDYINFYDVENQEDLSICWIHTANTVLGVNGYQDGLDLINFSEKHVAVNNIYNVFEDIVNPYGYNKSLDAGGTANEYAGYLFRHQGPIFQSDYDYTNKDATDYASIKSTDVPSYRGLIDVDSYSTFNTTDGCTNDKIKLIKELLITRGSVGASLYALNMGSVTNYIYTGSEEPNHSITIVGWDDNYAGNNFGRGIGNGAWIIRNSWGKNVGKNGYQYISYFDKNICNESFIYNGVKANDYDNAYYSAEHYSNVTYGLNEAYDSVAYSVKLNFSKGSGEILSKISFNSMSTFKYDFYYSPTVGTYLNYPIGTKTSTINGVDSIEIDPIAVSGNGYITIVQSKTSTSPKSISLPLSCKSYPDNTLFSKFSELATGEQFLIDNFNSYDIKTISGSIDGTNYDNCKLNIYAYTKNSNSGSPYIHINSVEKSNYSNNIKVNFIHNYLNDVRLISIKIYDENNDNVTKKFDIDKSKLIDGEILLKRNNVDNGTYKVSLEYNDVKATSEFTISSGISSSKYLIENNEVIIKPDQYGLSVMNIIGFIDTSSEIKIYNINNNLLADNEFVGTGSYFTINNNKYTIIIGGDINGDGEIDPVDLLMLKRHILPTYNLTLRDEYLIAADTYRDNEIDTNDLLKMRRFILGKETIW